MRHPALSVLLYGSIATNVACSDPIISPPVPDRLIPLLTAPEVIIPGGRVDTISVQLLAANGGPVPGYAVEWSGDGEITPLDDVTDDLGLAHAQWVMPRYPESGWTPRPMGPSGHFTAHATVGDLSSVSFTTRAVSFTADRVDASGSAGCGIREGGLWCWGETNGAGRAPHVVPLPIGVTAAEVQVGGQGVCVLDTAGKAWCKQFWPDEPFVSVADLPSVIDLDKGSTSLSARSHFCARGRDDSTPWCWSFQQSTRPTAVQQSTTSFEVVQAGIDFWCGLDAGGAVWCQGENARGQLGDGTQTARTVAVQVQGLPPAVSLSANARGACAATFDGTIWCWGDGPHGEPNSVPVEITVPGIRGTQLYVSETSDGFVIAGGEVRGWWRSIRLEPFMMALHFRALEVSGGGQACVHAQSGEVFCSWIMAIGGGDTSPFPSQLVPLTPVP